MAMQPRISATPRRSAIPITERPVSPLADALDVAARTAGQMAQSDRTATQQVDAINHQLAVKRQQEEDNALLLQQAAKWAETESRIAVRINEARSKHGPGGAGHVKTVTDIIEEEKTAFDGGFGENERVRQRYTANVAQAAARYETNEVIYASEQFAKAQSQNADNYLKATGNGLQLAPDLQKMQEAVQLWNSVADGMALNDDQKAMVRKKGQASLFSDFLTGLINTGKYADAKALLNSGQLNNVIDDVKPFLRSIEAEENAMRIAGEQAASDARKDARDAIKAIEEQVKLGIMPTQAEFDQARARGQKAGLEAADMIALDGLGLKTALNRQFGPAVDPMGVKASSVVAQLAPKIAAGKASKDEQATYAHLKSVAEASAKSTGASMKALAGQGVAGQRQVLEQLRAMPAEQRYMAANEAKAGLGILSLLGPKTQTAALDGQEVRKARPKDFGEDKEVKAAFARKVGSVGAMMGGQYDDTLNTAWNIYAGALNAKGRMGWDQAEFDNAVRLATGATLREDGAMQGGIGRVRGHQVQLPDWKTPAEFDVTLSTLKFDGAIYADGRAASKADILANYRPEFYRDDANGNPLYRFVDARGNLLGHKDGFFNVVVER